MAKTFEEMRMQITIMGMQQAMTTTVRRIKEHLRAVPNVLDNDEVLTALLMDEMALYGGRIALTQPCALDMIDKQNQLEDMIDEKYRQK
jgi:hypothetical protein